MTASVLDVLGVLQVRVNAVASAQKAHPWTTPEHRKKLDGLSSSVGALGVTFKLSTGAGTGPSTPRKADPLSLGVGVSAKTAAAVKFGVSLGVGFSASLTTTAALLVNLHAAISLVAGLERNLVAYNVESKAIAGTNGVMPPGRHADPAALNSSLASLGSKISESHAQASSLAPPVPKSPLTGEIRMARVGAWHADLATDDETALTGKVSFKIDDLVFVGTVLPGKSGLDGSRARCHIVSGNGGLNKTIGGRSYTSPAGVKVGAVLRDILHECGEDLSDLSDGPTLDKPLSRWHVSSGPANEALNDLAEAVGASWRALRDGSIWFGVELWPEVSPDHQILDEDWSAGAVTLAPETANMVPGVTYRGHQIQYVVHQLDEHLRTEVRTDHPRAALDRYMQGQQRRIDYTRDWPCSVVLQNPDGTLQLLPDDEVMQARGLDKVSIRYGIPGFSAKIKSGARCHLAFAAGDPARPFAHNWEHDPDMVESVSFNNGVQGEARIGDLVQSGGAGTVITLIPVAAVLPAILAPAVGIGLPYYISFSAIPPIPMVSATPLYGAVMTGATKLKG